MKSTLFNWVMYFSFANVFFPSKFPHIRQCLSRFVQCGSRKDIHCYSKICKTKIEFFVNIRMTRNSEKKTNKSYDKTAARNDPGNNTKKNCKLDSGKCHA